MNEVSKFKPVVANSVHEPLPKLVEHIERLLADAKSGKLRAIGYAVVEADGSQPDGNVNAGWVASPMTAFALSAAIARLERRWGDEEHTA